MDLQHQITEVTTSNDADRQTPSAHRRGDLAANVTQGSAQGTTKIPVANADPFEGHTRATRVDLCDKLADECKNRPLYQRGFVSAPTTATAKLHNASEQH